jgi:hypothetical protein
MVRAALYLVAAGIVWVVEGFIFARMLDFAPWQTVLMAVVYIGLWAVAAGRLLGLRGESRPAGQPLPEWRYLSLAPMLAVIVGSFVSLPILLLILALGKAV